MQSFYYCNAQLLESSLWSGDNNSLQRLSAMSQKSPLLILFRNAHSTDNRNAPLPLPQSLRKSSGYVYLAGCAYHLIDNLVQPDRDDVKIFNRLLRVLLAPGLGKNKDTRTTSFGKKWHKANEALIDVKANLDSTINNVKNVRSSLPNITDNNVLTALDRFVCSIFEIVVEFRHDRARHRDELLSLSADVTLVVEGLSLVLEMITSLDNQLKNLTNDNLEIVRGGKSTGLNENYCYSSELQDRDATTIEETIKQRLNAQVIQELLHHSRIL
uniref:Uncharacterized protein n=1 Tax=Romanomermis culicivorax TaxID=13658 RepID=A0A915IRP1_ROMCU